MKRLLLLAFIWGWSFLFIKVAVEGMTPPTVACLRVGLGAATLLIVLRLQRHRLPVDRTTWRYFTVAAVFGNALPFTMLAWGEERITSGLTAVLNASTPLFTALAAAILLRDRLRPPQILGLVLGLVGVAVAAGFGAADLAHSSVAGSLAAILAGASYGIAFAYMRRNLTNIPPAVAATGQLVMATLMLAPFAVLTSAIGPGIHLTPTRVLAITLLGVIGTGIAYLLNYRVIAELGATRASLVTYVIPVVAVAVGVVVLDEPLHFRVVIGGALIVLGIAFVHERLLSPKVASTSAILLLVVVVAMVGLPGCGSGSGGASATTGGAAAACRAPVREALDPNLSHILPGAPAPSYLSDPPTSGPHQPAPKVAGVVTTPIDKPIQVGLLEAGVVLLQYRGLDTGETARLAALAGPDVVVAPAPMLPAAVVATAWRNKLTCTAVDTGPLSSFIADHAGKGVNQ